MSGKNGKIVSFNLRPGQCLAKKYVVGDLLGAGWEGEVYHVREKSTGIEGAAKLFFPQRNPHNRAVKFYAKKLHKLKDCSILIRYHTQEDFEYEGGQVTALVSEYVEGELLKDLVARQRGKRLTPFEGLHLLHGLAAGIEQIHSRGEYHGDIHDGNIIVNRRGLGFDLKLVDFYHWGRCTKEHMQDDLLGMIRIFYDAVGGQKHYAKQPPMVKGICLGLKRSLVTKKFRSVGKLRHHLETMAWE